MRAARRQPMGSEEAPAQPPQQRPRDDGGATKSTKCVVGLVLVGIAFGVFLLVRIYAMGCGCPAPHSSTSLEGTEEREHCECDGGAFRCKYDCPGGQQYCGQELCDG